MRLDTVEQYDQLLAEHGSITAVAKLLGIARSTLRERITRLDHTKASPVDSDDCLTVLPFLNNGGSTVDQLCEKLDRSPQTVKKWLDELQNKGYNIQQHGYKVCCLRNIVPAEALIQAHVSGTHTKIGIVADTHLGSKYQQLTHLKEFYAICDESNVGDIFHVGDLVAGLHHRHDIFLHEAQDQIDYAVAHYPKRGSGKQTKIISGNHDLWFVQDGGIDPVKAVAKERSDIEFLGEYSAYVELKDSVWLYLLHPDKGAAYADSYRLQKLIESFDGGDKPHMAVMGHFHRALYLNSRNVDGLLAGCFEGQTDYLRRKAVQPRVGGWIIEIDFNKDNTLRRVKPEFISWPQVIKHDY